ncbi:MAG TPA: magnesium transporter [Caulobacteraceae bacterium]
MSNTMDDRAPSAPAEPEDHLRDDYALDARYVERVVDAADRGDQRRLAELLEGLHPADVADLMGFLQAEYRDDVLAALRPDQIADVLSELDEDIREDVLDDLTPQQLADAVSELDSDDAADIVEDLEADKRSAVLAAMPAEERAAVESSLGYGEETAGRLMQREVMAAPQFWNVGQTIDHMRGQPDDLPELFFDIYVVDPSNRPVGAVPVSALLRCKRDMPLTELMEPVREVEVHQDQEEVAYAFNKYHLISAPVVDSSGRLVGQITVDDIVGVIQEETEEDILALAGVGDEGRDAGVFGSMRARLPWLAVNLLTAMLAAGVISAFEASIAQLVALAVLMPIVASLGGNAGTQALTVTVRGLALRELNASNAFRLVRRELMVAFLNGCVLALLIGVAAGAWFRDPALGGVIGLAMVLNLIAAGLAGALVPLALDRVGQDPAVSSSVFVTAVTDIIGFFVFLGLATIILL